MIGVVELELVLGLNLEMGLRMDLRMEMGVMKRCVWLDLALEGRGRSRGMRRIATCIVLRSR